MDIRERLKLTSATDLQSYPAEIMGNFIPVKIDSLFVGSTLPCNFYFPTASAREKKIRPGELLHQREEYLEETHRALMRGGIKTVYIDPKDENDFFTYFNSQVQRAIKSLEISTERKTQLLYSNAESIVSKFFREHPNESNIQVGKQLAGDFAHLLKSEQITTTALFSLFSKDYYTFNHSVQVATLGMSFCNFLNWDESDIADFGLGALFHDVGKNSIGEEILNKPGKLEKEEFDIIKQHALMGYQQLMTTNSLSKTQLYAILYHHESTDGSGYPDGLAGNEIPLYARISHIVDVFDALTSKRVYKEALSQQDALTLMNNEMRSSFDLELLGAFSTFIKGPESSSDALENKIQAGIGTRIILQCRSFDGKTRSTLIGMEPDHYIILKISEPAKFQNLARGMQVTMRYIYRGEAYGFNASILETMRSPSPLIFISYPKKVEKLELRCERRIECLLPAVVEIHGKKGGAVVVDLSFGGCRISIKDLERNGFPPVIVNEFIAIDIKLPGRSGAICLRGRIRNEVKNLEGSLIGVQFLDLTGNAAEHLRGFIDEIMELAM